MYRIFPQFLVVFCLLGWGASALFAGLGSNAPIDLAAIDASDPNAGRLVTAGDNDRLIALAEKLAENRQRANTARPQRPATVQMPAAPSPPQVPTAPSVPVATPGHDATLPAASARTSPGGTESRPTAALPQTDVIDRPLGTRHTVDGENQSDKSSSSSLPIGNWLWQTLLALGLVIGLIYLCRAGLMRLTGQVSVTRAGGSGGMVEVLSRTGVGPRQHITLIRLGQRVLVVSETPTGMSTLAQIDDPLEVAQIFESVEASQPGSATAAFRGLLQRFSGDYASVADDEGLDDQEVCVDRVRDQLSRVLSHVRRGGDA